MSTTTIGRYRARGTVKRQVSHPVKAGAKIWRNQHLALVGGYAIPWPAVAALGMASGGIAVETVDNTLGADGDLRVEAEVVAFLFFVGTGADAFTVADIGAVAFGMDEATVGKTNGSGTRSPAGRVVEVILPGDPRCLLHEQPGVYVTVGDVDSGLHRLPIVISLTITEALFTGAGLTEAINLGGLLPTGAKVKSVDIGEGTVVLFSGGSAASATLSFGTGGVPTALRTAVNVFTGATGFPLSGTAGALGFTGADWSGLQLQALLTVTTGTTGGCTAGSVPVNITFDFSGT